MGCIVHSILVVGVVMRQCWDIDSNFCTDMYHIYSCCMMSTLDKCSE